MRTVDPRPRRALEADLGLPPGGVEQRVFGGPEWARCQRGEWAEEAMWAALARQWGVAPELAPDLRRRFFAGDRLDDELVTFIRSLRPRLKTALLSNFSTHLSALLDEHGLSEVFDAVIISAQEGVLKPDARIYRLACRRLGVPPAQAVFVDDAAQNVAGARQAGLQAIQFAATPQIVASLRLLL